jgi:hypothetical protein
MRMPSQIITRLLEGEHFNMDQRKAFGLLPAETLSYAEVRDHLALLLADREWFPAKPSDSHNTDAIHEGIFIHHVSPNRFICYARRASTENPLVLAEQSACEFGSAREAADYYLRWELNLPGRLDGWVVE